MKINFNEIVSVVERIVNKKPNFCYLSECRKRGYPIACFYNHPNDPDFHCLLGEIIYQLDWPEPDDTVNSSSFALYCKANKLKFSHEVMLFLVCLQNFQDLNAYWLDAFITAKEYVLNKRKQKEDGKLK